MVSPVPPSDQTANKQWMKYGALSDWHMIFRKDGAEAPQHLAFETLMKKKDLKMKAGGEKYNYQKTWKGQALLYPHLHANQPVGGSHIATAARREKSI